MSGWTIEDIETNRDLVMAQDPTRSGPLFVQMNHDPDRPISDLPTRGDIDYLTHTTVEGGKVVFHFDIPAGAPRVRSAPWRT